MGRRYSSGSSISCGHAPMAAEGQDLHCPLCRYQLLLTLAEMCLNLLPSLFSLHCWYSHCFCRFPLTDWCCLLKYMSDLDEQSVSWQMIAPCVVIQRCRSKGSSFSWYLIGTAIGNATQTNVCVCGECGAEQDCCSSGGHSHHHENPQHCQVYCCPPVRCEKVLVVTQRISQECLRKK